MKDVLDRLERVAQWTKRNSHMSFLVSDAVDSAVIYGRKLEKVAEAARNITHRSAKLHAALADLDHEREED